MSVAAVLLAGGESRRMGAPKPLLDWRGQTLIEYQIEQLREVADRVVVVLGHNADELQPLVRRAGARAVVNDLYAEGRASSVRVAAAALPDSTSAVVFLNVDQPRPASVTRRLIDEHARRGDLITVPVFEGKRGHPVVIGGTLISEMRGVQEETLGLRALLQKHARATGEVTFDTPVVLLDLNNPGEYESARERFANVGPAKDNAARDPSART